eukprot:702162-Karenia_brevis.AAC.1
MVHQVVLWPSIPSPEDPGSEIRNPRIPNPEQDPNLRIRYTDSRIRDPGPRSRIRDVGSGIRLRPRAQKEKEEK